MGKRKNKFTEEKQKIGVIGLPHTGGFPWQTTLSMLQCQFPPNTKIIYQMIGSSLIYEARDQVVNYAKKINADWILFIDSDMQFPKDMILKMTNTRIVDKVDKNKYTIPEMITGMAFKRIPPFQPCFYTKARINPETKKPELESPMQVPDDGFLKIEGCGMACCYINMSVIKKIDKLLEEKNQEKTYFFPYYGIGEDLSFCIKARMAGVDMYVDASIQVGHVGDVVYGVDHYRFAVDKHLKENNGEPLYKEAEL